MFHEKDVLSITQGSYYASHLLILECLDNGSIRANYLMHWYGKKDGNWWNRKFSTESSSSELKAITFRLFFRMKYTPVNAVCTIIHISLQVGRSVIKPGYESGREFLECWLVSLRNEEVILIWKPVNFFQQSKYFLWTKTNRNLKILRLEKVTDWNLFTCRTSYRWNLTKVFIRSIRGTVIEERGTRVPAGFPSRGSSIESWLSALNDYERTMSILSSEN